MVEGPGEDPYLGARFAEAVVKGFQGDGFFDDPFRTYVAVDKAPHRKLTREMAGESMLLLKNNNDLLPLPKNAKVIPILPLTSPSPKRKWESLPLML